MGCNVSQLPAPVDTKNKIIKKSNEKFKVGEYKIYKVVWTPTEFEYAKHIGLIVNVFKLLKTSSEYINKMILRMYNNDTLYLTVKTYDFFNSYDADRVNNYNIFCKYLTVILVKEYNLPESTVFTFTSISGHDIDLYIEKDPDRYNSIDKGILNEHILDMFIIKDVKRTYFEYNKEVYSLKYLIAKNLLYELKRKYGREIITFDIIHKEYNNKLTKDIIDYIYSLT